MKPDTTQKITNRLHRIEGQIRGIEKMIDRKEEIDDIIIQVQAINSAMTSLKKILIKEKIDTLHETQLIKDLVEKYIH